MKINKLQKYFQDTPLSIYSDMFFSDKEHYRLLADISYEFDDVTLYDIGTYRGLSALALSANKNNTVVTYDIVNLKETPPVSNIEYVIGDFFTDKKVIESPLIMFDVDPHDGVIEDKFFGWLLHNSYKGNVLFDDIHLNEPMQKFWDKVVAFCEQSKNVKCKDLTNKGHWSGTGLVCFL